MSADSAWSRFREWCGESPWARRVLIVAVVGAVVVWLFRPAKPDFLAWFDQTVEAEWRVKYLPVEDAIAHLESGKPYLYDSESGGANYDRSFVLPLLQRLTSETGVHWLGLAYPDDPDRLFAVIGRLPEDAAGQAKVRRILKEEDEKFAGAIFDQWGHHWLGIDYFTPEDVEGQLGEFLEQNFPSK